MNRLFTTAAACLATTATVGLAPMSAAEPAAPLPPPAPAGALPPPPPGAVASEVPGRVTTPDGWELEVVASSETQLAVSPLTTALSSRAYQVGGTFNGTVSGKGSTKLSGGTLEVGYQIGCGISLSTVKLNGSVGLGFTGSTFTGNLVPTGVSIPIQGQIEVHPQPGEVINVSVDKKKFKAAPVRVTVKDISVKIDGCVGQSFLRSYAVLTSSTSDTDDIVAYYGVAKVV